MKTSVCIESLLTEWNFVDRIEQAARLGADAVEFWDWVDKDLPAIKDACTRHNIRVASFLLNAKDPKIAEDPGQREVVSMDTPELFLQSVRDSLEVAQMLGARSMIISSGLDRPGVPHEVQHRCIVQNLKAAAPLFEAAQVTAVLEPLNVLCDHAGNFLVTSKEGFEIVKEVGSPYVKLLFDIYHQQISEGNLIENITANIDLIGHFHAADVPGRHQLGTGEIHYRNVFAAINRLGYQGYCGLEYFPNVESSSTIPPAIALMR